MGTGSFSRKYSGGVMVLTSHPRLAPMLKKE
jgi:hypothetical protein